MNIIQRFWGWFKEMFSRAKIKEELNIEPIQSDEMTENIQLWADMYADNPPWKGTKDCVTTESVNLPALIASELARLVTIEVESKIANDKKLDKDYQKVIDRIREQTEYGGAKGGLIFKPYKYRNRDEVFVDYVQADRFIVTKVNAVDEIIGIIFPDEYKKGEDTYKRLEVHELDEENSVYTVKNYVFKNDKACSFKECEKWQGLEPELTLKDIEIPLFAHYKPALANNIDSNSPLGVSWYSRAVKVIEEFDVQFNRLLWEFESTETAIEVDESLLPVDDNGNQKLTKREQRLYKSRRTGGSVDSKGNAFFQIFSPNIRDANIINGLNYMLQMVEDRVGLARGTFSLVDTVARTATELLIMRQRSSSTIRDNQKALQTALERLADVMQIYKYYGSSSTRTKLEVSFEWDDSVVSDKDTLNTDTISAMLSDGYVDTEWAIDNNPLISKLDKEELKLRLATKSTEEADDIYPLGGEDDGQGKETDEEETQLSVSTDKQTI